MATEKRLIDATPIIDGCEECSAIEWNKSVYTTWAEAEEDFLQRLLDAPTVDAVEVVRCKDCKQLMLWCKPTDKVIGECFIRKMNSEDEQFCMVGADDFCSYGERKNND